MTTSRWVVSVVAAILAAVALWFYGYWCAGPTYQTKYIELYQTIMLLSVGIAVPAFVVWRWLTHGKNSQTTAARTTSLVSAYIAAWMLLRDFRSNSVHPKFSQLFLVFELTLVVNFLPWIFLTDWLRQQFKTSEATMYLPALLIVSLDVLPFPAMVARRFRASGRSIWWTLPTLLVAQLSSYLILVWVFGYCWATSGK